MISPGINRNVRLLYVLRYFSISSPASCKILPDHLQIIGRRERKLWCERVGGEAETSGWVPVVAADDEEGHDAQTEAAEQGHEMSEPRMLRPAPGEVMKLFALPRHVPLLALAH